MKPGRILCPVDFSEATDAGLTPALSLATELGAELVLLHVLNFPYPQMERVAPTFDLDTYYGRMEAEARQSLEDLIDSDTRRFAPASVQVHRGLPYLEIVRVATETGAGLIVMPTHGRTGVQRLLFGSTAEKVVRMAPCPVLTVSPRQAPHVFQPDSILFATDFSSHADEALCEAMALAMQYEAKLTLLHVVTLWENDPANPAWRFPAVPDEYRTSVIDVAAGQLEARRHDCDANGVAVDALLVRGFDPGAEIVRAAVEEVGADLLVLGTHGHTGLAHALLGSVAEKVVRMFDGPVLTIRKPAAD